MVNGTNEKDQPRCRLGLNRRLKQTSEFERVYSGRFRAADERLMVYARTNGLDYSRIGLSVGKKMGSAPQRNHHKRTLREAFRLNQHQLPAGYDYVLIPRPQATPSTRLYGESLKHLCRKLHQRHQRKHNKQHHEAT